METLTLIELEEKLKRMREQGADDATPVKLMTLGQLFRLNDVKMRIIPWTEKRIVELSG